MLFEPSAAGAAGMSGVTSSRWAPLCTGSHPRKSRLVRLRATGALNAGRPRCRCPCALRGAEESFDRPACARPRKRGRRLISKVARPRAALVDASIAIHLVVRACPLRNGQPGCHGDDNQGRDLHEACSLSHDFVLDKHDGFPRSFRFRNVSTITNEGNEQKTTDDLRRSGMAGIDRTVTQDAGLWERSKCKRRILRCAAWLGCGCLLGIIR